MEDEVLFVEGMELFDYVPDKDAELVAVVYFSPKLKMAGDINWGCKRPNIPPEEDQYQIRIKELQRQYRSLKDDPEGIVTATSNVLLDLTATVEGKPYVGGSFQGQWVEVGGIPISELRDHLIGHSVDDLFECEYPANERDPQYGGKPVQATIKIHNLQQINSPEVNDDLAKDAGFDDLASFKKRFSEDYVNYIDQAHKTTIADHITTQIIRNSELPPLPHAWIDLNVQRMADQHVAQFGKNKKAAMAAIGVKNEAAFKECFKGQFYRNFMGGAAMRKYKELYGVEPGTDEMYQDMLERVRWINADETNA